MNSRTLRTFVSEYHQNKSRYRKMFTGNPDRQPSVSKEMEALIQFINLSADANYSEEQISRLKVLLSVRPNVEDLTKAIFRKISFAISTYQRHLSEEANRKLTAQIAREQQAAVAAYALLEAEEEEEEHQADAVVTVSPRQTEEEQAEAEEEDEHVESFGNEYDGGDEEAEEEKEEADQALIPVAASAPQLSTTPPRPLSRSPSTESIHTLLLNPNGSAGSNSRIETEDDRSLRLSLTSTPTPPSPVLLSAQGINAALHSFSLTSEGDQLRSNGPAVAVVAKTQSPLITAIDRTPLLSQPRPRPAASSSWAFMGRNAAIGLTWGIIEYANSRNPTRAVGWGLFYFAVSYATVNNTPLIAMASILQTAANFYEVAPVSLLGSAGTLFGRALLVGGTQTVWNALIPTNDTVRPGRR
jgi:hypothetical protein